MKAHLYGTSPYVPDGGFLGAEDLSIQTGGNTGNLMFCHSISRMFATGVQSIPWGGDLSGLASSSDILVMPLANQLGPHVDLGKLAERISSADVPIVGVGLGAQGPIGGIDPESIPAGSWLWLKTLISKAPTSKPNISLRGVTTHQAIAAKGYGDNCLVTGCPSNFLNPSPTLGREIYRRRANRFGRVALAAGNPFLPQFKVLERSLVELMENSGGLYVCQHPLDMLKLVKQEYALIEPANFIRYKDYIHPLLDDDGFLAWFRRYAYSFSSVPEWIASMSRFDLVIGTRIHGVMAGVQAGVPSLCMCIDSRTLELCKTMGIPHVDANKYLNGISRTEIEGCLDAWDWRHFDENRRELAARFRSFADWNGLVCHGSVVSVLKKNNYASAAPLKNDSEDVSEVHQAATNSFEGRYSNIFSALRLSVSSPAPKILSFGCSDGYELSDLAGKYFQHAHVVGCDVDPDALRIASLCNKNPSRVMVVESNEERLRDFGLFDAVVAMTVFCRWPETKDCEDISEIYPFERFEKAVSKLFSMLRVGGVLCIYNSNYRVADLSFSHLLEVIDGAGLIPKNQQVKVYAKSGLPLDDQKLTGILFRKLGESTEV